MTTSRPRIWYVCNKCNEWFLYENLISKNKCLDCKKGILVKTCAICGKDLNNCKCVFSIK